MTLFIGMIIGLVLGLTGAGGSVFAVPLFITALSLPVQQAIGLSLGAVAVSALFGVITRLSSHEIQWQPAIIYAAVGSLFAPVGIWLNQMVSETILLIGFSALVLVIAIRLWRTAIIEPDTTKAVRASLIKSKKSNAHFNATRLSATRMATLLGGATATGLLSGLFGVGGGFLIVPSLLFLIDITTKQAVATSLVVISAISSSGFINFILSGADLPFELLTPIATGGLLGMSGGIYLSRYLAGPQLQKIFSLFMVVMAVVTLSTQIAK